MEGIHSRTSELPEPCDKGATGRTFPTHFPIWAALPTTMQNAKPATPKQKRPRLHPSQWPEIAERARYESLRDLAAVYGVSHETIRAILGCMAKRNAVAA
jgi:hypothetical protein